MQLPQNETIYLLYNNTRDSMHANAAPSLRIPECGTFPGMSHKFIFHSTDSITQIAEGVLSGPTSIF